MEQYIFCAHGLPGRSWRKNSPRRSSKSGRRYSPRASLPGMWKKRTPSIAMRRRAAGGKRFYASPSVGADPRGTFWRSGGDGAKGAAHRSLQAPSLCYWAFQTLNSCMEGRKLVLQSSSWNLQRPHRQPYLGSRHCRSFSIFVSDPHGVGKTPQRFCAAILSREGKDKKRASFALFFFCPLL